MNRLGCLYLAQRSYDAEKMSLEVLSLALSDHGSGHPRSCAILAYQRLGVLYNVKRDYERSEPYFRHVVDWFSKKFTVDDIGAMMTLLSLLEEVLVYRESGTIWTGYTRISQGLL